MGQAEIWSIFVFADPSSLDLFTRIGLPLLFCMGRCPEISVGLNGVGTPLLREVEVEDYYALQVGDYYVFYVFVDGVGEVFVAGGGAVEGHDEAVGVVVVEAFGGVVGAEVEI